MELCSCEKYNNPLAKRKAMQKFPEPTVGALVVGPGGKILLVKTHKWRGRYGIPGGHVELGETMEQALKRELLEETGLRIYGISSLGIQEFIYGRDFWKKRHFIFLDFSCRTKSTKLRYNREIEGHAWVSPQKALRMSALNFRQ